MSKNFLQQRHAAYKTSLQDLGAVIRKVLKTEIDEYSSVKQGYANEVYLVKTSKGHEVIIRIQHHGPTSFEQEVWAMAHAKSLGVPMPLVYEVGHFEISGEPKPIMVMQKADGNPLSELQNLNLLQQQTIYKQFGLLLSKLHRENVKGFGFLKAKNVWEFDDRPGFTAANLRYREDDLPYLIKAGLTESETLALLSIVNEMTLSREQDAVLCHGDLSLEHIFVDANLNITAFIDWGMCQGGSRTLDIAVLLMYHPHIELPWILQGYEALNFSEEEFRREMIVQQVNVAMSFLGHSMREGNEDYKEIAVQGMRSMLSHWQSL